MRLPYCCKDGELLNHTTSIECQKQSSSAYGTSAIFPADSILPLSDAVSQQLSVYSRPLKAGGTMDCYFCKTCGSRMFHQDTDASGVPLRNTVCIKGGVIEGLDWSNAQHIYTSRAVVAIPDHVQK